VSAVGNGRLGETEYAELVTRVREAVVGSVPPGASLLVVSKGDAALLELPGHTAGHFPQDASGSYAGHHPRDSESATAELERLRRHGAEYLVIPETARWWLDFYAEFATHLANHCQLVADVPGGCLIYGLGSALSGPAPLPALADPEASAEQLRDFLERLVAPESAIVVLDTGDDIAAALAPLRTHWLPAVSEDVDPRLLLSRLRQHALAGADYLVVPRRAKDWLKRNRELADELEVSCRIVADQRHLCLVFELAALREEI
jgi:hypothetical protein